MYNFVAVVEKDNGRGTLIFFQSVLNVKTTNQARDPRIITLMSHWSYSVLFLFLCMFFRWEGEEIEVEAVASSVREDRERYVVTARMILCCLFLSIFLFIMACGFHIFQSFTPSTSSMHLATLLVFYIYCNVLTLGQQQTHHAMHAPKAVLIATYLFLSIQRYQYHEMLLKVYTYDTVFELTWQSRFLVTTNPISQTGNLDSHHNLGYEGKHANLKI